MNDWRNFPCLGKPLPRLSKALQRRYPGVWVRASDKEVGVKGSGRMVRAIDFVGPMKLLLDYGLAEVKRELKYSIELKYGDGLGTQGLGDFSFDDKEAYIVHHLPIDDEDIFVDSPRKFPNKSIEAKVTAICKRLARASKTA